MSESQEKLMIERALKEARIILDTHATIRQVANIVGVSKSTVHKDMNERLPIYCAQGIKGVSKKLVEDVSNVIAENKAERHIRGGEATRRKFSEEEDE